MKNKIKGPVQGQKLFSYNKPASHTEQLDTNFGMLLVDLMISKAGKETKDVHKDSQIKEISKRDDPF